MRTMEIVRKPEKADMTEGSLNSHLQRSMEKTINARKSKGMGSHLCPCHSERMMPLPPVQSHFPAFQGTDGTLSRKRVGMTLLQNQPLGHHSHRSISHEPTQLCPLSEMSQAICHERHIAVVSLFCPLHPKKALKQAQLEETTQVFCGNSLPGGQQQIRSL